MIDVKHIRPDFHSVAWIMQIINGKLYTERKYGKLCTVNSKNKTLSKIIRSFTDVAKSCPSRVAKNIF